MDTHFPTSFFEIQTFCTLLYKLRNFVETIGIFSMIAHVAFVYACVCIEFSAVMSVLVRGSVVSLATSVARFWIRVGVYVGWCW